MLTRFSSDENSRKALDNITFSVPAGQKLAIVGRTGSGKSTLLASLFRLLDPSQGRILIDNLDISSISRDRVRSRLNAISEDQLFLHGSIRLNLDPYQSSTDAQLRASLEKVQLWNTIHAKGGLDADWNDDMLSHGQKQMFCLARALLRPSQIVVLDEISSAVDRETDHLIQKVVREEFEGKTVICIAHRLSTVMDFDQVIVLGDGKVVEYGSPRQLMDLEGGKFRELAEKGL
jgi:ABC-type multidrug transport system fused ATPase/permease subunit